jgi:hypothetical protein
MKGSALAPTAQALAALLRRLQFAWLLPIPGAVDGMAGADALVSRLS